MKIFNTNHTRKALRKTISTLLILLPFVLIGQEELKRHYTSLKKELKHNVSEKQTNQQITEVLTEKNATWLRLFFEDVNLGTHSTVTISSHLDGESQTLDAQSIKEWNNSSAYFNGDQVTVTLNVAAQDTNVGLKIKELGVGEEDVSTRSQCGSADDRSRSSDNAIGRLVPIGCTGWIIRNGRLVTAGHCATSRASIIEFNVPLSNADRSIVHPPVRDQYAVNNFVTNYVSGQPALDWAVFRASTNTQTGQTPIQAQGRSFNVTQSEPSGTIRITGFGTDTGTDNQVQQTHTGPRVSVDNTFVRYSTDTTGGNSGSPIIDNATGNAVGVHAYGGCNANGGSNFGERSTIPEFWDAMGLDDNTPSGNIVRMIKRNASGFSLDGKGGSGTNNQNVHLWSNNSNNVNQQWLEVNHGGGYYSYLKRGTQYALDGGGGGSRRQNLKLWLYNSNNFNQHWRKVNVGGGYFRLEKRNASGFSIDGNGGGRNGQNVYLWNSNNNNQNQHWQFVTVGSFSESTEAEDISAMEEGAEIDYDSIDDLKVSLIPNPSEGAFNIQFNENIKDATVSIYSILGQKKGVFSLKQGDNHFNNNLSLSSGIYVMEINSSSGSIIKKLIIK